MTSDCSLAGESIGAIMHRHIFFPSPPRISISILTLTVYISLFYLSFLSEYISCYDSDADVSAKV